MEQQTALSAKITEQEAVTAAATAKLASARAELATISAKVSAENGQPDGSGAANELRGSGKNTSALTAQAVRGFFQALPASVSDHPEGRQSIEQVMALLERLDSAAKEACAEPHAPPSAAETTAAAPPALAAAPTMELDDDFFEQMAEAAVAPAEGGEDRVAERRARVAEAKARLKSRRPELERVARVKKMAKA